MTSNSSHLAALVMRMQDGFLDTPALRLTPADAERRFGVDRPTCEAVLGVLADSKVLVRLPDGAYTLFFPRLAHAA